MVKIKPNIIMHIEDDDDFRKSIHPLYYDHEVLVEAFGGELTYVGSDICEELSDDDLEAEIVRIETEAGDGPAWVNVVTGQIARAILGRWLPGAVISDTGFPLNGQKVVEWLMDHDLSSYPVIGLSATRVGRLEPCIIKYFVTGNARYFEKQTFADNIDEVARQIIYNRDYVLQMNGFE